MPAGGRRSSPTAPIPSTRSRSSRWSNATSPVRGACSTSAAARVRSPGGAAAMGVDAVGVDPTLAPDRRGPPSCAAAWRYAQRDGRRTSPSPTRSFDAVVMCLVIEHLDPFEPAIQEMARVLGPGGRCLLLLNHPLLQTPGSGWIDDHILEEQYWRVGAYLRDDASVEELAPGVNLPFMHRPLSRYVQVMGASGLLIEDMDEPRAAARLPERSLGVPRGGHHPPTHADPRPSRRMTGTAVQPPPSTILAESDPLHGSSRAAFAVPARLVAAAARRLPGAARGLRHVHPRPERSARNPRDRHRRQARHAPRDGPARLARCPRSGTGPRRPTRRATSTRSSTRSRSTASG